MFYNTLIKSDDPALVVECLNGYRLKEKEPSNYGEFTVPIGIPEIVKEGNDITVVSYGSTFNQCEKAAVELDKMNIQKMKVHIYLRLDNSNPLSPPAFQTTYNKNI